MKKEIIQECYKKSIELLLKNSTRYGILAASRSKNAKEQQYLSIFGRDASICSLGMVASGNKKLIKVSKSSLISLGKYQAVNGQIPNYVKPERKVANFWYTGCIDATMWWLLAIKYYDNYSGSRIKLETLLRDKIEKSIDWLCCQEHPGLNLVQQNEASS